MARFGLTVRQALYAARFLDGDANSVGAALNEAADELDLDPASLRRSPPCPACALRSGPPSRYRPKRHCTRRRQNPLE